jgi:acyl-homoserine lactone acylase PvdQ
MNRFSPLVISHLVLVVAAVNADIASAADQSTTIRRDEFGVPHIFAPSLEHAAYAAGYAQAEDRLEELLKNFRRATGTMAEVFGADHFDADLRQRVMRHAAISQTRYSAISPKMRGVIEWYQAGIKQFMKDHPEQVPLWSKPIQPWEVVALGRYIIWNWPMGEAAADLKRAGLEFGPLSYRGSNEMLIAPKRPDRDHRPARPLVRRHAVLRGEDLLTRVQRGGRFDPGRSAADLGAQSLLLDRHDNRRP